MIRGGARLVSSALSRPLSSSPSEAPQSKRRDRTALAVSTNASHSSLCQKPFRNASFSSASRTSSWTSLSARGKLLDVQVLTWQARTLLGAKGAGGKV